MSDRPARSLKWHLIRRLLVLQAAMLALLVLLVVGTLWSTGHLIALESEDDILDALQGAVARSANGALVLQETPALARQRAAVTDFWFVIRDRDGHSLSQGPVPREYARIGDALDDVSQARLGWNLGDPPRPAARLKWVEAAAGRVQILTGPGGTVSWRRVAFATSTLFLSVVLPIALLMSIATIIATPLVVRKALAGLDAAAAQADRIEIDRRGARLPHDGVPAEVMPLVAAVNDALRRLDDGYERHHRFLADAAHELRTPIAILQTRLESLPRGPETTRLLEDVARLSIVAEQLLDLQRLKQQPVRFASVDLVAVGRRVASDLAPLAIAAGYDVSFDPQAERVTVLGDESAIERALTNLVQNAIQHGGRRGLIAIHVTRDGTVAVTDQGVGVPPEHRDRVFEPFHRLDARSRGVGLGLNLVREIVALHQGQIAVRDGPEGGARFEMTFRPVAQAT
jgi:signal transduction histidine kinase